MENNLKQIRNSKNLLQTKVAMDLNTTQETISSYETGRVFPSSDMLIDDVKPNNISDTDFILLNKINSLSTTNKAKIEGYIDGLKDN